MVPISLVPIPRSRTVGLSNFGSENWENWIIPQHEASAPQKQRITLSVCQPDVSA